MLQPSPPPPYPPAQTGEGREGAGKAERSIVHNVPEFRLLALTPVFSSLAFVIRKADHLVNGQRQHDRERDQTDQSRTRRPRLSPRSESLRSSTSGKLPMTDSSRNRPSRSRPSRPTRSLCSRQSRSLCSRRSPCSRRRSLCNRRNLGRRPVRRPGLRRSSPCQKHRTSPS
jgi:hypothetical protein